MRAHPRAVARPPLLLPVVVGFGDVAFCLPAASPRIIAFCFAHAPRARRCRLNCRDQLRETRGALAEAGADRRGGGPKFLGRAGVQFAFSQLPNAVRGGEEAPRTAPQAAPGRRVISRLLIHGSFSRPPRRSPRWASPSLRMISPPCASSSSRRRRAQQVISSKHQRAATFSHKLVVARRILLRHLQRRPSSSVGAAASLSSRPAPRRYSGWRAL